MEIIFSRLEENACRFTLGPIYPAFANALRRSMIGEVPTLAIDDVRIYDNTSALFDEAIAHRLGLIPIRTDLDSYVLRSACSCDGTGCPACTATFTMSVEGPKTVYSRDLIPEDPQTGPADANIPIVKLTKDQKVVIEARAVLSSGREHAKWQPTSACGYKNYPVIRITEMCDACGQCVEECPRGILRTREKRVEVIEGKIEDCSLCRLCEKACLGSGIGDEAAISVNAEPDRYIFVIEGDGSLPVRQIIERGLMHLQTRSNDLIEQIDTLSGGT
jgi:DNA-directed RNA polymerase subunit D